METASIYKSESSGAYGEFALSVTAGATKLPNLETGTVQFAIQTAVKLIENALMVEILKNNPAAQARAAQQRKSILSLFPGEPFVEEIPNGYCSDYCCAHLPWFVVTTVVGRIKIGWRKRVLLIDWSGTHRTKKSHELFADEKVTKDERMIHASDYEAARRYIDAIIRSEVAGPINYQEPIN